ncbi:hypothetical protein EYF80_066858 [Liparis tanakae]|uniref:Uncharacterized protein n=1 Tax=Liparis tanakae TaxID=230148 RepID=A0A4Z2E2Y5_9TELE|nr:hypothetical protein EYF80_066858 [Liparis tanakae]
MNGFSPIPPPTPGPDGSLSPGGRRGRCDLRGAGPELVGREPEGRGGSVSSVSSVSSISSISSVSSISSITGALDIQQDVGWP